MPSEKRSDEAPEEDRDDERSIMNDERQQPDER